MLKQLALLDETPDPQHSARDVFIRPSRRARRLTLRVVPPYRIELVVPRGTSARAVQEFLRHSRAWIERARAELDTRYPAHLMALPRRIELAAVDRRLEVALRIDGAARPALEATPERLVLTVPSQFDRAGFELLRQWLLRQGRACLKPLLLAEAQRIGLVPERIQIRTQRTRWGSCSAQGGISLNAALLLLRRPLVRYLMIHELCHLKHLNHSTAYWRLVGRFDPDFRAHDRALADAWTDTPLWALPRYA